MTSASASMPTPEGPASVSGAPNLPVGFTNMFTSRYVEADGLRLHAVIGGDGPPLLLVHGWPDTWYAWRLLMPALARRLTMPVLAIGGAASFGELDGNALQAVADDVQRVVIPEVGHFVAEEAPEEMLAALTAFLAPYRDATGSRGVATGAGGR